jgi:hypothetical protein
MIKSRSSFPILSKVNQRLHVCREYLMYNRVPGLLAVVCFGSSTPPPRLSRQQVFSLSQSSCLSPVELILTGEGGRGGVGAKSYDDEKALSSIKNRRKRTMSLDFLNLKVHKIEIFFDSDFGIGVISFLFMSKY